MNNTDIISTGLKASLPAAIIGVILQSTLDGTVSVAAALVVFASVLLLLLQVERKKNLDRRKWHVAEGQLLYDAGKQRDDGWEIPILTANKKGIYGPYISLPTGRYRATFRLKIDNNTGTDDLVTEIDVICKASSDLDKRLAARALTVRDFSYDKKYQDFPLDFYLLREENQIEFRVRTLGISDRTLVFDSVRLTRKRRIPFIS